METGVGVGVEVGVGVGVEVGVQLEESTMPTARTSRKARMCQRMVISFLLVLTGNAGSGWSPGGPAAKITP